jgi:predicted phosphodiesterase
MAKNTKPSYRKDVFCPVCDGAILTSRKLPYCSMVCEKSIIGYSRQKPLDDLKKLMSEVRATTAWKPCDLDKIVHIVADKIGIISDLHAPMHSEKWLYLAVKTFLHFGVKKIILNGDSINADQISKHAGSYFNRRKNLEDDLDALESVLNLLRKYFDEIYISMGNHDMRLVHQMGGELSVNRLMKMVYSDEIKIKVTSRSYIFVNDHVEVIHPRQYSKIRGKLAQDLSMRWQKSILTGHQHHSTMTISPCGRFQSCDVGTLVDVELQDYVRNERTTHVEPVNGFAIIFNNKIQLFDKFTNFDLFGIDDEKL